MSSEQISSFLNAAIRNRIAVRLIAEQHIVLSRALQNTEQANATNVGIVDMALSPVKMIRMCASFVSELCEATLGSAPQIVIDGATDATFAYVCWFISSTIHGPTCICIQLCSSPHGIHPNRDPQELLPRHRRAPT
jgi:hypothetical protein